MHALRERQSLVILLPPSRTCCVPKREARSPPVRFAQRLPGRELLQGMQLTWVLCRGSYLGKKVDFHSDRRRQRRSIC